jgi:hypothetical protein
MILALAAFVSIVLADPQIGYRPPTRFPAPTPPRITFPRPTPVPGPFRNPAIPPRTGGGVGRFGRQVDFGAIGKDIIARIQGVSKTIPGIPGGAAPIALPTGLPGIPDLTRTG